MVESFPLVFDDNEHSAFCIARATNTNLLVQILVISMNDGICQCFARAISTSVVPFLSFEIVALFDDANTPALARLWKLA